MGLQAHVEVGDEACEHACVLDALGDPGGRFALALLPAKVLLARAQALGPLLGARHDPGFAGERVPARRGNAAELLVQLRGEARVGQKVHD
jgi:hypothetical protein